MATNLANLPEQATATGALDFISCYTDYADVLEAPRIFHEITAIQLVGSILNRSGVTIPNGAVTLSLDQWLILLSSSGGGRSTLVGLIAPILKAAGMENLESLIRWGSGPAFYQHFAEHPSGLYVWGELGERLKILNQPGFRTVKEWLTDRYDNFKIPPSHFYRQTGKKSDTPPIVFEHSPRINIIATSAHEWFFHNVAVEDSSGGFLPRWLILRAEDGGRDVAIPKVPDTALVAPLAKRLAQIGKLTGPADLTAIETLYETWYIATKRRFESQPNPAMASAYFHRHRGHALKLAVVFEASENATLAVSARAWERAVQFAEQAERCIFRLLPTGMSAPGFELQKIEERIKQSGSNGLGQNELTRCFQSMPPRIRAEGIQTLLNAEKVYPVSRPPGEKGGRPKTVYVHSEFRQEGT